MRDGAFHDGGGLGALANLACEFVGDAGGGGLSHVLQGLLHLAVGENVEEGRLRELSGQALAESAVENRIAGGVGEIG